MSGCGNSNDPFFTSSAFKPPSPPKLMSSKKMPYNRGLTACADFCVSIVSEISAAAHNSLPIQLNTNRKTTCFIDTDPISATLPHIAGGHVAARRLGRFRSTVEEHSPHAASHCKYEIGTSVAVQLDNPHFARIFRNYDSTFVRPNRLEFALPIPHQQ